MFVQIGGSSDNNRCIKPLARRPRVENASFWAYTTRFWGKKFADLKDNAVNNERRVKTIQQNFYMENFLSKSEPLRKQLKSTKIAETSSAKAV